MALSTEATNAVKQKVRAALAGANPCISLQFKGLWQWLATHKSNPALQFVPIADLTADAVAADAACKLYAIYLKKGATATDAYYNVFDDASDDSTAADAKISIGLVTSGEEACYIQPDGFDLAAGLVHGSYTALIGYNATTASTSGDGPASGFVVIGDA